MSEAHAGWHSQSDELPGISSGALLTIAAAGVVVVGVIWLAKKSGNTEKNDKKDSGDQNQSNADQPMLQNSILFNGSADNSFKSSGLALPAVMPYAGLQPGLAIGQMNQKGFSQSAVVVGLSINF